MRTLQLSLAISALLLSACRQVDPEWSAKADRPADLHEAMQGITEVMVHDILSPPQSARVYAYASVAAYEAGRHADPALVTAVGQLNGLDRLPEPTEGADLAYSLSAAAAALRVGQQLLFSEDKVEEIRQDIYVRYRGIDMPEGVFEGSVTFGDSVAADVLRWAAADNYAQSRTFPKFSITRDPARWRPTPPDYMSGIEPHWRSIRSFTLDSAEQFKPLPPPPFDLTEGSEFHDDIMEVYTALEGAPEERKEIAAFWDCNPYVSHHRGHVMFATKKISPGGHWMGIAKTVAQAEGLDLGRSLETYLKVSIALADGFISCWDEKYRSSLVRPETVINEHIDPDWQPVLQTPPFPEYTSGHSVISRAAATAMTDLFGEGYAYVDSVEIRWGLPERSFESFYDASEEAAISRLYGGIHYGPAIFEGLKQGQAVGDHVLSTLRTRRKQISRAQQ